MNDIAPIVGLRVSLNRTIDVPCSSCGEPVVVIGLGAGPLVASLHCATCERHRGWMPKAVVIFLLDVVSRFGWPQEPIFVRKSDFAHIAQIGTAPSGASADPTTAP